MRPGGGTRGRGKERGVGGANCLRGGWRAKARVCVTPWAIRRGPPLGAPLTSCAVGSGPRDRMYVRSARTKKPTDRRTNAPHPSFSAAARARSRRNAAHSARRSDAWRGGDADAAAETSAPHAAAKASTAAASPPGAATSASPCLMALEIMGFMKAAVMRDARPGRAGGADNDDGDMGPGAGFCAPIDFPPRRRTEVGFTAPVPAGGAILDTCHGPACGMGGVVAEDR